MLTDGGYEAFTIAAVCARASVPPRAIYDRAVNKDALFLAVYEHGITGVRADNARFSEPARWENLSSPELLERAVRDLAEIFRRHADFLRPIMLVSGVQPEIYRRGAQESRELGEQFTRVLLRAQDSMKHPDPETQAWTVFNMIFSALVMRTMYGPGFAAPANDDETFTTALCDLVGRYLLS